MCPSRSPESALHAALKSIFQVERRAKGDVGDRLAFFDCGAMSDWRKTATSMPCSAANLAAQQPRSSDDMARATRHNLDQRILESWHRHEAAEPDISTERLMAMVRDDTGAEPDRQVEALQRAGMLRRN